jgi:hypothetical protein
LTDNGADNSITKNKNNINNHEAKDSLTKPNKETKSLIRYGSIDQNLDILTVENQNINATQTKCKPNNKHELNNNNSSFRLSEDIKKFNINLKNKSKINIIKNRNDYVMEPKGYMDIFKGTIKRSLSLETIKKETKGTKMHVFLLKILLFNLCNFFF